MTSSPGSEPSIAVHPDRTRIVGGSLAGGVVVTAVVLFVAGFFVGPRPCSNTLCGKAESSHDELRRLALEGQGADEIGRPDIGREARIASRSCRSAQTDSESAPLRLQDRPLERRKVPRKCCTPATDCQECPWATQSNSQRCP